MLSPPAPLLQPGNPLRISTRGESTAMKVTTTSCTRESAPRPRKKPLPSSSPLFPPVQSQPCSSRSHRPCRTHHEPLRTVSGPSLCLWKVPAAPLAVSAKRPMRSHVASGLSASMANPGFQCKGDSRLDLSTLSCLELGYFIQHHTVRGKRKSTWLPKRKRSAELCIRDEPLLQDINLLQLKHLSAPVTPANTQMKGLLLTPALIHGCEGTQLLTAAGDQEGQLAGIA